MLFYMAACIPVAIAGRRIARGEAFGQAVPRLVSLVGILIAAAAFWEVFGAAILLRLIVVERFTSFAFFDASYVALGVIGFLLWLIGQGSWYPLCNALENLPGARMHAGRAARLRKRPERYAGLDDYRELTVRRLAAFAKTSSRQNHTGFNWCCT